MSDNPDEALARLWLDGLTASQIGAALGRTRNSVISRAHRLDLPRRPNPVGRIGPLASPRHIPKPFFGPPPPPPEPPPAPAPVEVRNVSDLPIPPARGCQYPLWGHNEQPTHLYCDRPRAVRSYCLEHARVCYL